MQEVTAINLHLRILTRLLRLPLALMVALTGLTGALCAAPQLPLLTGWAVAAGIFLLSAAGSVLNQVLERTSDALMRRTAGRPLASGALVPRAGTSIGILLMGGGLAILATGAGTVAVLLGLAALAWYLLVYTPLKRLTPLAVLAGTPCGAIPPLLGWLAAGGPFPAPQPLALALVMVLWQVPHYWLLALPDRAELTAAGFHALPALSDRQLLTVSCRWLIGLAIATALLPLLALPVTPLLQGTVSFLALAMVLMALRYWLRPLFPTRDARRLRSLLHLWLALTMGVLLADALLNIRF